MQSQNVLLKSKLSKERQLGHFADLSWNCSLHNTCMFNCLLDQDSNFQKSATYVQHLPRAFTKS